jgi:group I intron endonuclease
MFMYYVYEVTNLRNGKTYIGQRIQRKRAPENDGYFGSGKVIKQALEKYGVESFRKVILAVNLTEEQANLVEIDLIAEAKSRGKCEYNIAQGGQNWNTVNGKNPSTVNPPIKEKNGMYGKRWKDHPEWKRASMKGENNPIYGRHGRNNKTSRAVTCITTGEVFESISDAARILGIDRCKIQYDCKQNALGKEKRFYRRKYSIEFKYEDESKGIRHYGRNI